MVPEEISGRPPWDMKQTGGHSSVTLDFGALEDNPATPGDGQPLKAGTGASAYRLYRAARQLDSLSLRQLRFRPVHTGTGNGQAARVHGGGPAPAPFLTRRTQPWYEGGRHARGRAPMGPWRSR